MHAGQSRSKAFIRSQSIPTPQVSRGGAMARVDRVWDRDNDVYKEKVVDCETGEVIFETEGKLRRTRARAQTRATNDYLTDPVARKPT
jgi:hypothetical protein